MRDVVENGSHAAKWLQPGLNKGQETPVFCLRAQTNAAVDDALAVVR